MSTDIVPDESRYETVQVEQRELPSDIGVEQTVLGAMMLSADAIGECIEIVKPRDFYRPAHQTIYECLLDMYGDGKPTDALAVSDELRKRGELVRVGAAPYLHTLMAAVQVVANAPYLAEIIRDKALDRRTIEAGQRIVEIGYHGSSDDDLTTADMAREAVDAIDAERDEMAPLFIGDGMGNVLADLEAIQGRARGDGTFGVPTGFTDLDAVTNGMQPGQFVIIAGRPGLGKSTLALDFCRAASIKHGIPSAVFSLEMSRNEILMRILSAQSRIRLSDMRGGRMTEDDWKRARDSQASLADAPIVLDDSPLLTMQKIRSRARKLRQRHKIGLIVVDYMQLMASGKRVESRQQEVAEFSRSLKLLAKELEIPVVAVSQLNRGPEQRQDRKPSLGDLRESGALEQDADIVILLHRPDAADRDDPRQGECDLLLAKHRSGPQATITVAHQLHLCRFVDMAKDAEPAPADAAFDREYVRGIDPVAVRGDDQPAASTSTAKCRGCRDRLIDPAEIETGYHSDCAETLFDD